MSPKLTLAKLLVLVGLIVGAISQVGGCDEITAQIREICDDPIGPPRWPEAEALKEMMEADKVERAMRAANPSEITLDRGIQ